MGHYKGTKCECDGIIFDSIPEKEYYIKLKNDDGVEDLQVHPNFTLQQSFRSNQGKTIRAIKFKPDFMYIKDGHEYIEDVKLCKELIDSDFTLRFKLLQYISKDSNTIFRLVAWNKKAKEFVEI